MSNFLSIKSDSINQFPTDLNVETGFYNNVNNDYAYGRVLLTDALDASRTAWSFADDNLTPVRGDTKVYPEVAANLYVASSSAADTDIEITVSAIDSDGNKSTYVVNTDAANGQTPVLIAFALDINFVFMTGSNQENLGNIYFTNLNDFTNGIPNTVSSVLAHVPIGYGCSPQATVRVPKGVQLVVNNVILSLSRSGGALGSAIVHCYVRCATGSWIVVREWHIQNGQFVIPTTGMTFDSETIMEIRLFDVSNGDTNLGAEIHFSLVGRFD